MCQTPSDDFSKVCFQTVFSKGGKVDKAMKIKNCGKGLLGAH